eukprot:4466385-Pyramimonas_sp.AAC.1
MWWRAVPRKSRGSRGTAVRGAPLLLALDALWNMLHMKYSMAPRRMSCRAVPCGVVLRLSSVLCRVSWEAD